MDNDSTPATTPLLRINLAVTTGPLRYGASGFLYGLGDDGIPTEHTLLPIKPQIAAQKAPNGLQHPNGDAFRVADTYLRAGGRQIQIYIQDIYPHWPYDKRGLDEYLTHVDAVVQAVVVHPHRALYAYVPFNEPDLIWYDRTSQHQETLRQDWKTVYQRIRATDRTGLIVGPNFAAYHEHFVAEFLTFCQEHDCLPDIISWHELNSDFYADWYQHYEHYRALERRLNLAPRAIAINEYANFMDLSVPGQLMQWIARFEHSKVDACLAYWHAAGDLCNLVVHQNQVTGGWWLYKWYADMTGETVLVTPPNPRAAGLQGIAAVDHAKQQIRVVFGGVGGEAAVVIQGFDAAAYFGAQVHVVMWSTAWTGVEGVSRGPAFEMEADYTMVDNQITVPLDGLEAASAYAMIITSVTPTTMAREHKPWKVSYEAEDATLTHATIQKGGALDRPTQNYCSNGRYVSDITHDTSRVTFSVMVPATATYLLDIFYANPHGAMAQQLVQLDNQAWMHVEYPPNVGSHFVATQSLPLALTQGPHSITFATYDPSLGRATLSVDLDKIDLTQVPTASAAQWYGAEYASLAGSAVIRTSGTGYAGTGYVAGYGQAGDAATAFVVTVEAQGVYTVGLHYATGAQDGTSDAQSIQVVVNTTVDIVVACPATTSWDSWATATVQVFLHAGINRIIVQDCSRGNTCVLHLDGITIGAGQETVTTYAAATATNTLGGTAFIGKDPYASGGRYVAGIGNGAANYLEFNGIDAPASGKYWMMVSYANAEKIGTHDYNVNIVDRGAEICVNGGSAHLVYFRNTFGWNAYRTTVAEVHLTAGANTIRFSNHSASAPHIDKIAIAAPDGAAV